MDEKERPRLLTVVIWLIKALAAGALALILLSVVVTGYEFTGTHIDNPEIGRAHV